jgi:hypothetical protein
MLLLLYHPCCTDCSTAWYDMYLFLTRLVNQISDSFWNLLIPLVVTCHFSLMHAAVDIWSIGHDAGDCGKKRFKREKN